MEDEAGPGQQETAGVRCGINREAGTCGDTEGRKIRHAEWPAFSRKQVELLMAAASTSTGALLRESFFGIQRQGYG
jgi:hypothetical protein